ncbi:cation:dicarboxylate symporter family transporter, partial [Siminovitchia fortis]|uniref:cation:dicarboxylate symporter family transporter n=1 Tax=Siminovitchia fortis TaxID=254758 RepID=UPI0011A38461
LEGGKKIGVGKDMGERVLGVGGRIEMDGCCVSGMVKIGFVFGVLKMDYRGMDRFVRGIGIGLLWGVVMRGIGGGGLIGEMVIVR